MKMERTFTAARPVVRHCPELTERGPRPEERAELLAAWRRDLADQLAQDLAVLLSNDRLNVKVAEPEWLSGTEVLGRIGPVAANSLLRVGVTGVTALLSIDFANAIALTDRSFGGGGRTASEVPERLPRSAALLVEEAATMVAGAMARIANHGHAGLAPQCPEGEVIIRSESAARLRPFAADALCASFALEIGDNDGCQWGAMLAIASDFIDPLLPDPAQAATASRKPDAGHTGVKVVTGSFGTIPLSLHAVLAEFDLPLGRLGTLAPGDQIPLVPARHVPIKLGDTVLAYGSIGTLDDQMALRLTRLPEERLLK
ncbi:flagellar motor switch protein FliM [Erythrobacter litoralis]|jgi:flagellar motor switch protein FliM|nr:flagellar motor switch protein FliM [Erythrobacter litoralis]